MTNPTHYYRPQTLAEAIERAVQPGSIALAGGALTLGGVLLPHETVVDLQDLDDLKHITTDEAGLHIGGSVTLQAVVESASVPDGLKQSLTRTLPINIRNGASVAESLMTQEPPCEWLAALVALDAVVEHAGNLHGHDDPSLWEQPVAEFVNLLHQHGHTYQGIIVQIRIPRSSARQIVGTAFVSRTPADSPIVNAAVRVTLAEDGTIKAAVVVLGGVSDTQITSLKLASLSGKSLGEADLNAAAEFAEKNVSPVSDSFGSAEYRQKMAGVCVRRALEDCRAQV
jgi:CO/xanthine dehydrogenase FAD-binding subunit